MQSYSLQVAISTADQRYSQSIAGSLSCCCVPFTKATRIIEIKMINIVAEKTPNSTILLRHGI